MKEHDATLLAIIVTHVVIILVQFAARRLTTLPKSGMYGIYFVLLPMGFQACGVGLDAWLAPLFVSAGLLMILVSLRRGRVAGDAPR